MSDAFAAARELLQQAEEDAARLRVEADRYARQREQEAELLVAKARRLLEVAEGRAAAIDAAATRAGEPLPPPRHMVVEASLAASSPGAVRIDVDATTTEPDESAGARTTGIRNDLDRMLADAISKAVDRSFSTWP